MNSLLKSIVTDRIRNSIEDIRYSIEMAKMGNPLGAEQNSTRRRERLQKKNHLSPRDAAAIDRNVCDIAQERVDALGEGIRSGSSRPTLKFKSEQVWGDTIDFVDVSFLTRGAEVSKSVGRVAYRNGRPQGSGVLIGNGLFLTNNHVIEYPNQAAELYLELDYERNLDGSVRPASRFEFDPTFFVSDSVDGLDFTIIGVGRRVSGNQELSHFGYSPLSDASDKHMLGEFANIIQHPNGRFKEVVLRENRLVNRYNDSLHYVADTEPGSSGSPVFNSEWQMIALHHWGGPWIDLPESQDHEDFEINEGIRISSIVRMLRIRAFNLPTGSRDRLLSAINPNEHLYSESNTSIDSSTAGFDSRSKSRPSGPAVGHDGEITWTFPIEVSVRIPSMMGQTTLNNRAEVDSPSDNLGVLSEGIDYSDRNGYQDDFLDGYEIPLPVPKNIDTLALLINPERRSIPYELKYQNFSVIVNKRRKLAMLTACLIDGRTSKSIGRTSRNITDLNASDTGLSEMIHSLEGAEADSWVEDHRIRRDEYSGNEIYSKQNVPGFPNPRDPERIKRMFQKGHLVRRLDPAWGTNARALKAELDTFHWTNAAPQVGYFNQGKADENQAGTGKGNLWRAAENYVLRNAVAENQKVISFTGPIFRGDDRPYRNIKIPSKFFKVTAWVESGELRSIALLVDQSQVFREWPESFGAPGSQITRSASEAFLDDDELDKIEDFLSSVSEIEALTNINFGEELRQADVRSGLGTTALVDSSQFPFSNANEPELSGILRAPKGIADDLKKISGIGPKLEQMLNSAGVFHYFQISQWTLGDIKIISEKLKFRKRVTRDKWVSQATKLAKEAKTTGVG